MERCFRTLMLFMLPILIIKARASAGFESSSRFMNSLKNYMTYDKRIRPYDRDDTLNVTVGMTIFSFGEIVEIEGEFSLDIFFHQSWSDPRLRHNNTFPIILSGKNRDLVWLPDTFFINIKTAHEHDVPSSTSVTQIMPNGEVQYSTRITLTAGCEIDLHRYPLDSQTCKLRIMSYAYRKDELDYRWKGDANTDIFVMDDHMAQLVVTDIQRMKTTTTFGEITFSELAAVFQFKRRLGYALLQVYAPTFLIVALSWLSFWISINAVSARIALGITTVLTIVTLNGSFRSTVPKVSYIKALDLYLIVSFLFVFCAVLEYIAVLLHSDYVVQSKIVKAKKEEQEVNEDKDKSTQEVEVTYSSAKAQSSTSINNFKQSSTAKRSTKATDFIKKIISVNSTPIDKISKIAFPLSYIVFNVAYWIIYTI